MLPKILSLMCLVLAVVVFTSCEDDGGKDSGQVELLSFGPSGVHLGDEIVFIGKNLNKVTAIVFPPSVEVPSSAFTSMTKETIKLNVPNNVEPGKVILKTPDGDIESKTIFSLEVPVTISSITAEAKPGTNVTITGENINWIDSVTFYNGLVVTKENFVSQSQTELVVTVPMEAQTGFLTFYTGGTEPLTFDSEEPLTVTLPVVTVLTPGSIRHTENLTLTGTDLDLVTKIDFSGGASVSAANFVSQSETEIVVAVPATTTKGPLTLTVPSGLTVETDDELTIILPNVTAFSPSSTDQHTPGATLTLTGTNLDLVGSIKFPNVANAVQAADFVSQSATQIQVVIPTGAQGGTVIVNTIHNFAVAVSLPFGNQLTLAKVIFDDAVQTPFQFGGGWGGATTDASNTENPRIGTVAVKATFAGGYSGACQFGNWGSGGTLDTSGMTYLAFSIYGETGTDGKTLLVNFAGAQKSVTVAEGTWTDVKISLADFGSPASVAELSFQDAGWSGTVFIDQIGLK